jgi:hypothetical protein
MRIRAQERKFTMPVRPLPVHPDLNHLKFQARDLLKAHAMGDVVAAQRIREFHPRFARQPNEAIFTAPLKLTDAQLTIARESGFASWTRLKERVQKPTPADDATLPYRDRIQDAAFRRALDLLDAGDVEGLRSHLNEHPQLTLQHVEFEGGNYFRSPTLLEFIAENPIRNGQLPKNILQMAKVILDAGVETGVASKTLSLVATGRVPRECGMQIPFIDLLCDYGADPDGATHAAAFHGEHEAVHALLKRGARLDLPVAAALGRKQDARRLLAEADAYQRHAALGAAAQFGHAEIVGMLLDEGEDPDRYNAESHSHSTPLHQATLAGHVDVVRLLVERGARLDMKDVLWGGTAADWAAHEGRPELESYLRNKQALRSGD